MRGQATWKGILVPLSLRRTFKFLFSLVDMTAIKFLSHCTVHKVRWRGSTLTSTLQSRTSVSRSTKDRN